MERGARFDDSFKSTRPGTDLSLTRSGRELLPLEASTSQDMRDVNEFSFKELCNRCRAEEVSEMLQELNLRKMQQALETDRRIDAEMKFRQEEALRQDQRKSEEKLAASVSVNKTLRQQIVERRQMKERERMAVQEAFQNDEKKRQLHQHDPEDQWTKRIIEEKRIKDQVQSRQYRTEMVSSILEQLNMRKENADRERDRKISEDVRSSFTMDVRFDEDAEDRTCKRVDQRQRINDRVLCRQNRTEKVADMLREINNRKESDVRARERKMADHASLKRDQDSRGKRRQDFVPNCQGKRCQRKMREMMEEAGTA